MASVEIGRDIERRTHDAGHSAHRARFGQQPLTERLIRGQPPWPPGTMGRGA
jgi:hypothetical protein